MDVIVPPILEEIADAVQTAMDMEVAAVLQPSPQEYIQERIVKQRVNTPVPPTTLQPLPQGQQLEHQFKDLLAAEIKEEIGGLNISFLHQKLWQETVAKEMAASSAPSIVEIHCFRLERQSLSVCVCRCR